MPPSLAFICLVRVFTNRTLFVNFLKVMQLHESMISLCESLDLPHWAVFIALHMPISSTSRHYIIRNIILRAGSLLAQSEMQLFLRDQLDIPIQWVHESRVSKSLASVCLLSMSFFVILHPLVFAQVLRKVVWLQAQWYYYKGDYRKHFIHLLRAGCFVEAHRVFCRHVGAIALENEGNDIGKLVMKIAEAPVEIPMWKHGGALYLEFER